jgi:hypothetical protein
LSDPISGMPIAFLERLKAFLQFPDISPALIVFRQHDADGSALFADAYFHQGREQQLLFLSMMALVSENSKKFDQLAKVFDNLPFRRFLDPMNHPFQYG